MAFGNGSITVPSTSIISSLPKVNLSFLFIFPQTLDSVDNLCIRYRFAGRQFFRNRRVHLKSEGKVLPVFLLRPLNRAFITIGHQHIIVIEQTDNEKNTPGIPSTRGDDFLS